LEKLVAQCFGHAVRALAERGPSAAVFGSDVQRIRRQLTPAGEGPVGEFACSLAIGAAGARVLARLSGVPALADHAAAAAEELFVQRHKKLAGVQRLPHPAATPWQRLTGMLATIGTARGVVLGPVDPATPALLRVDLEDGGGLVVVDASVAEVDPLPFDVSVPDRGSSSTRCPAKRPLYSYGHIPAGLATETMLRNMRRQTGQDQQPIATYLNHQRHGEAWVPLYAVADTVALPELTPARAASWQANRTCCECGARRERPIPKGPSGERACRDCVETVSERWWHQQRRLERADAQLWAAGVLADPAAVLVREERLATGVGLCAVTIGGQVLIDTTIRADLDQVWVYPRDGKTEEQAKADFLATHTEPGDLGLFAAVHSLGGRRLVAWRRPHDGVLLGRGYEWSTALTLGVDLTVAAGDDFTDRCTRWIGERAAEPHVRWAQNPQLQRYPTPTDMPPIEEVQRMRVLLQRMAQGADPAV
jgi:hypothetical protein